jgi:hypothetical protein
MSNGKSLSRFFQNSRDDPMAKGVHGVRRVKFSMACSGFCAREHLGPTYRIDIHLTRLAIADSKGGIVREY